jgi:hypothetical protein
MKIKTVRLPENFISIYGPTRPRNRNIVREMKASYQIVFEIINNPFHSRYCYDFCSPDITGKH